MKLVQIVPSETFCNAVLPTPWYPNLVLQRVTSVITGYFAGCTYKSDIKWYIYLSKLF